MAPRRTVRVRGVTNVNPGNRDPRSGLGSSRIPTGRYDRYDDVGDGSFDEAYEEYYDVPADNSGRHRRFDDLNEPEGVYGQDAVLTDDVPAPTADPVYDHEDVEGYEDYNDYDRDGYADDNYDTHDGYGAHRDSDRYSRSGASRGSYASYDDYDGYDDRGGYNKYGDNARDDDTTIVPAAAGAGASSSAAAAGGVPKRGLAMILIAVALLLGLWGIYAMMQRGGSEEAAEQQQTQQNTDAQNGQDTNAAPQDPNGQDGQKRPDPNAQNGNGQDGNRQDGNNQNGQGGQNQQDANNPDRDNAGGPAGAGQPMTADNETINVYNNSTVGNLAADVSGQLRGQGTNVGEVGNIGEQTVVLEQNTVFFDPATPGAEERARVLAERVGGVAKANDGTVPREAAKPGSLTLVLTGPVSL